MRTTPLEMAKAREKTKEAEQKPCAECSKSERINGVLYCGISGKIVLPNFEHVCCCRGKYLNGGRN